MFFPSIFFSSLISVLVSGLKLFCLSPWALELFYDTCQHSCKFNLADFNLDVLFVMEIEGECYFRWGIVITQNVI